MSDIISPVNDENTVQLDPESLVARIIAELQANPEAQSLLLRALLTNEFLGMPVRLERIEADVAELKVDVAQLKVDVAQLKTDVAHLKGDSLEVKLHRRIRPLLSQRLNLRRAQVMQSPIQDTHAELYEPIEEAFDEGRITDAQETRIHVTDLIIRAQRKADRSPVWVVVEVSNEIHRRDLDRVRQTADALGVVFQTSVLAVVAGYHIAPRDQARADESNVHTLLIAENN